MKDETRDLRSELKVLTESNSPDNDKSLLQMQMERNNNGKSSPDSKKHAAEVSNREKDILDTPPSSSKSSPRHNNTLTPSARLSALNIVGDLLRKVGALELKLSSCRNIVKENGTTNGSAPATPLAPPPATNGEARRRSSRSATPTTLNWCKKLKKMYPHLISCCEIALEVLLNVQGCKITLCMVIRTCRGVLKQGNKILWKLPLKVY